MSRAVSPKNPSISLFILNFVALIGLAISVFLTQHFYNVRSGASGFKSYCNINQSFNCDIVTASSSAELFFGLPLASFAAGWFLALFAISFIAHQPFWRRESLRLCLVLSLVATLISIPYLFIMAMQLKTFCIFCLVVDGLNLTSLLLVLSLKPERITPQKLNLSQLKILTSIVVGCVLVSVLGLRTLESNSFQESDLKEMTEAVLKNPVVSVNTGKSFPSIGPADAPITIVEFSDFQCPFCRIAAFYIHSVSNRYPEQVRVIFRNYPLDPSCNPEIPPGGGHPVACEAARLAHCAHQQGKFQSAYETLFENQASFSPKHLKDLAKELGLDIPRLEQCMTSSETAVAIARDIEEGKALGIKSTPTFFMNGRRLEGAYPVPVWDRMIRQLLKK